MKEKSSELQELIRLDLISGWYMPGDRIHLSKLADRHGTSTMPVRLVLHHLCGDNLVDWHGRDGYHFPLLTAAELCEVYAILQNELLFALGTYAHGDDQELRERHAVPIAAPPANLTDGWREIAWPTGLLFETIACGTINLNQSRIARKVNDRLWAIRWAEVEATPSGSQESPPEELATLNSLWRQRQLAPLKRALEHYHRRRERLAPRTAAVLAEYARRRSTSSMAAASRTLFPDR